MFVEGVEGSNGEFILLQYTTEPVDLLLFISGIGKPKFPINYIRYV